MLLLILNPVIPSEVEGPWGLLYHPPKARTTTPPACQLHSSALRCTKDASGRGSRGQSRRTPLSLDHFPKDSVPSPLPQFVSSLSKYYRAEAHYPLLASIVQDTPESELRAKFGPDLYATGKQRYLTVRNGIVIRDKLIDFIHEEDGFTERVKMVMYFLFLFRDARYRQFMCEVVARGGKWQTDIFRDTESEYFRKAGGRKSFYKLPPVSFSDGCAK